MLVFRTSLFLFSVEYKKKELVPKHKLPGRVVFHEIVLFRPAFAVGWLSQIAE
jgi:hypothetical protein